MDILLGELVLMNARTELYLHFLENKILVNKAHNDRPFHGYCTTTESLWQCEEFTHK